MTRADMRRHSTTLDTLTMRAIAQRCAAQREGEVVATFPAMSQTQPQDSTDEDDRESTRPVAQNPKRGCGHLKHGKGYIRSSPAALDLPTFVELSDPVPFYEGHFRGYRHFPGVKFELAIMDRTEFWPRSVVKEDFGRMYGVATGDHVGEMDVSQAHDLIMWVGKTYYDRQEFIAEVRDLGLSKAIPISKTQEPPTILPGWTRCWCIHPEATRDNEPGIIGYAPIGEVIYTEHENGTAPAWAQEYDAAGKMVLAQVGDEVAAKATVNHALDEYNGFTLPGDDTPTGSRNMSLRDIAQGDATDEPEVEAVSVEPSDKPGQDVEEVDDDAE